MSTLEDILRQRDVIHVFGYGSLTWKPDFESTRQDVGFIKGYRRVFWQGSVYHRGTPQKPGRCATLAKASNEVCWGLVYEIRGKDQISKCLDHLQLREQSLGGYEANIVQAHLKCSYGKLITVEALIYRALPKNQLWLGDASLAKLGYDIATSSGIAGHNSEYLFKLCDWMRKYLPSIQDNHLFGIEMHARKIMGISVRQLKNWESLLRCPKFSAKLKKCDVRNREKLLSK